MNVQPQIQTKYIGIRLSEEMDDKLKAEASRTATTATEIIRRALREYFGRRNGRRPVK